MYKISAVKKTLHDYGINISIDLIRKLQKQGIIFTTISPKGHRLFTEEQFQKSVRNLCYYCMGASIEEIKTNGEVLKERGKKILKVAKSLIV